MTDRPAHRRQTDNVQKWIEGIWEGRRSNFSSIQFCLLPHSCSLSSSIPFLFSPLPLPFPLTFSLPFSFPSPSLFPLPSLSLPFSAFFQSCVIHPLNFIVVILWLSCINLHDKLNHSMPIYIEYYPFVFKMSVNFYDFEFLIHQLYSIRI